MSKTRWIPESLPGRNLWITPDAVQIPNLWGIATTLLADGKAKEANACVEAMVLAYKLLHHIQTGGKI